MLYNDSKCYTYNYISIDIKYSAVRLQLLDFAFRTDPVKVTSLLERRNPRWGGRNMMEISYIGHLRAFIASKRLATNIFVYDICFGLRKRKLIYGHVCNSIIHRRIF